MTDLIDLYEEMYGPVSQSVKDIVLEEFSQVDFYADFPQCLGEIGKLFTIGGPLPHHLSEVISPVPNQKYPRAHIRWTYPDNVPHGPFLVCDCPVPREYDSTRRYHCAEWYDTLWERTVCKHQGEITVEYAGEMNWQISCCGAYRSASLIISFKDSRPPFSSGRGSIE